MKLTKKTTANELKALLVNNADAVKTADKNLSDRVSYTLGHDAKRQDLLDLVKEVMSVLGDRFLEATAIPAAAETTTEKKPTAQKSEVKKTTPKTAKVEEKTTEVKPTAENLVKKTSKVKKSAEKTTEDTPKDTKTEAPKTEAPKTEAPKAETKKSAAKTAKKSTKPVDDDAETHKIVAAQIFPDTIEIDGEVFSIDHEVKTIEDLNTEDKEFEFAFYWTPTHLRKFTYQSADKKQPKSFPGDLDTCQLVYVSDRGLVAYVISDATEGFYTIYPEDMEETDGIRYSNHCEFQIYSREVTDEDESEDDETEDEGDEE